MTGFMDASRTALARIGRSVAERMVLDRGEPSQLRITGRAKRYVQPLRLIPGMPAAAEPCLLPRDWSAETHPRDAVAQLKIDGIRALHVDTSIVSREALPLDCALHCLAPLHDLEQSYGQKMVFDGEYREPDGFDATIAAMRRGEGVGSIWLFDAVPYDEWCKNQFIERLDERVNRLCELAGAMNSPFVQPLPLIAVPTAADALALAQSEWERGGEGIVVKGGRDTYARGKSLIWQKLKKHQTFDGTIVDMLLKDNRCQALMIRMPADSPCPGKVVRIGTNIPEHLREAIGRASYRYQGAVAEVGFTEVSEAGYLRGGYLIRMRDDKKGY